MKVNKYCIKSGIEVFMYFIHIYSYRQILSMSGMSGNLTNISALVVATLAINFKILVSKIYSYQIILFLCLACVEILQTSRRLLLIWQLYFKIVVSKFILFDLLPCVYVLHVSKFAALSYRYFSTHTAK